MEGALMTTSLDHAAVVSTGSTDGSRPTDGSHSSDGDRLVRISARFGIAFTVCQLAVMVCMAVFVLPHGGSPNDPALERGRHVLDARDLYRFGNYVFILAGSLLLGFLG